MPDDPIPLREGMQIHNSRAVALLERVTLRLAEFQEETGEEAVDIVFVIRGDGGTFKPAWSIEYGDVRPTLSYAGVILAQEAVT